LDEALVAREGELRVPDVAPVALAVRPWGSIVIWPMYSKLYLFFLAIGGKRATNVKRCKTHQVEKAMLRRVILGLSIVAGLWLMTPTPEAEARGWRTQGATRAQPTRTRTRTGWQRAGVPELDPSTAGSALILLIGGVAYIASRRREEEDLA